jgi:hypothetical protein
VPGHEDGSLEREVHREPGFLVEKIGKAGEESEEQDPRA